MNVTLTDFSPLVSSSRSYTTNGFLKAKALIARSGIQEYLGYELGLSDNPMKRVRIYRPESVVFDSAVLDGCLGLDITNDHPSVDVNSDTYKDLTCGCVTSKGERSAEQPNYIVCDILVKDKQAIQDIENGKSELSAGYQSRCVLAEGVTPEGEPYDGYIEDIVLNHVAIVAKGRAGNARILDHQSKGVPMEHILTIGDKTVELSAEPSQELQDAIKALTDSVSESQVQLADAHKAQAEVEQKLADAEAKIAEVEAKLADTEAKVLSDAQITELVKQLADTQAQAKTLCGADFVCDSASVIEIKRQALAMAFPKQDFGDKSADYIEARFDASLESQAQSQASQKALADALNKGEKHTQEDHQAKFMNQICSAWKN